MDVTDHIRLSQGEEVTIVQQILRRVLEALPADVSFRHAIGADRRAHRPIDDGDSTLEDLLKRMLVGCSHFSLMALRMASARVALTRIFHYSEIKSLL